MSDPILEGKEYKSLTAVGGDEIWVVINDNTFFIFDFDNFTLDIITSNDNEKGLIFLPCFYKILDIHRYS